MTPDDPIAVIGPLVLACLRGECPLECLRDAVAEADYTLPGVYLDEALHRPRRRDGRGIPSQTALRIHWILDALHGSYGAGLYSNDIAASAVVRHWREYQATAGTYYHETPR
jgi:hypothetical protein